jgi:Na+/H+ antiporter NhaB
VKGALLILGSLILGVYGLCALVVAFWFVGRLLSGDATFTDLLQAVAIVGSYALIAYGWLTKVDRSWRAEKVSDGEDQD